MNTRNWLINWKNSLATRRSRRKIRRRVTDGKAASVVQILEPKALLTGLNCFGQIEGITFQDINNDGAFNTGEGLSNAADGVVVHLYEAGLDNLLDSTGGTASGDDTFIATVNPDANGNYQFTGLAEGTYFVEQPTPAGFIQMAGDTVSGPIEITATDAQGTAGTVIDTFGDPVVPQVASANSGTPTAFSSALVSAIGGERDLVAQHGTGGLNVELSANAVANTLALSSGTGTSGSGTASWDGVDGAAALDPTGLGGIDLTDGGSSEGFIINRNGDFVGSLTITVHTDGTSSSSITTTVPTTAAEIYLPYSTFTGSGGGADFSNVGAVEMSISGPAGFDGEVDLFQAFGPTVFNADFVNFVPLTLGGTVFEDTDNSGAINGLEGGINGVTLTLFEDTNNDGAFDAGDQLVTNATNTALATGGDYQFDNLFPGNYIVRIDSSNFGVAAPLDNMVTSTGNDPAPDPDNDLDGDDNGVVVAGELVSRAITLGINQEPINDGDLIDDTNFSLDFGVLELVDITVGKSDNADPVTAGSGANNLVYSVTATNNGPSDATGVTITDAFVTALPTGWTLSSSSGTNGSTFAPGSGVWTIGNLNSGITETLTLTFTIDSSAAAGTETNTVTVSGVNETESTTTNNTASEDTTIQRRVDIVVAKSDSVDPVTAGSGANNLVYTVTATNNGPSDATGVEITDAFVTALPTGWTLVSGFGTGGSTFAPGTGVWTIGDLAQGTSRTLDLTFTIDNTAASGTVTNTATVTGVTETETDLTNNTASEDTTINRLVDIELLKSDNVDPVTAGSAAGNLIYTVTATNNGPSDATGVEVTDAFVTALPAGWSLVSGVGSGGSTFAAGTGVWTIGDLADNASETLTLTFTIDNSASTGTFTNTATVTDVNEPESTTTNNTASEDTTIDRVVDIEVLKSDNVDPVTAGSGASNLVYTVTARNNGPSDATGVEVTDAFVTTLPAGWTLVSGVGSGGSTFASGTGVWTIGNLADNASETLTLTFTVDNSAASETVTNTATVTGVNEPETTTANNTASEDTTINRLVDITVAKSDNVDPVTAGSGASNLVYTVTATNNGPSDASGVAVTDALVATLPTGWTLVSGVGTSGSAFSAATGVWTIGDLATTATETLTLTFTIDNSAASGTVTNTVTVTGVNEVESSTTNNTASEDTTVLREVDIAVTKTDNADPVTAGSGAGNLVYTITTTNNGPSDASGVEVTDAFVTTLPAGWTLDSSAGSGGSTFAAGTGIWTIGDLADGASRTLTLTFTVDDTAANGTVTNTATVSGVNETETTTANNSDSEDTTIARAVDIQVVKNDNVDPVTAGSGPGNLVYTVTATNNGPSDATGVEITDALIAALPTGWSVDSAVGTGTTTFTESTGVWTIGDLNQGDSETLTVTLTIGSSAAGGTTTNTALVSAVNENDTDLTNNTDSEDTTVNRAVDVQVVKNDNVDPVTAGSGAGNLVYTVVATNNGPSDASGVAITDALITALPTGWTLVSAIGTGGTSFAAGSGIWSVGDLATGASETLTITLTVGADAAAGTTLNTATVSAVNETDSNPANNTDIENTTVNRFVDVGVMKSDNVDPVTAGSGPGNLIYTIVASNSGPSNATGVTLTDALITTLPTGWSLVSAVGTGTSSFAVGSGIWTIGDLNAGASETLTVTITVDNSAAEMTTTNTVVLSNTNETDTNAANNQDSEDTTVSKTVDIGVTKSDSADPVTAGSGAGNLIYTVTATNNGPSNATGLQVTDALIAALPTGWSFVSATGTGGSTFDSGTGIWDIGGLNIGDSRTLAVTLTVGASVADGTTRNVASITALDQTDSNPANDTATEDTSVARLVDIAVLKADANDPITAGSGVGNLVYTVTATNNGPSDASGLQITDALIANLPTGFSLVSAVGTGGSTFDANTGIWNIGDLSSGATRDLTITVTVADTTTLTSVSNVAAVSGVNETDPVPGNDSDTEVTTIQRVADIAVIKTDSSDPVVAGSGTGNLTYTITTTNNGPSNATGVEVTDAFLTSLPAGVSIVSATGTGNTTFNSGTGIWSIGDVANGDSRQLTVVLTVSDAVAVASLSNTATISSIDQIDPNPSNDTSTETTQINREIDLVVTKVDDVDPVRSPGVITYTITVANNGPSSATNVVLTDTLSTQVSFLSATNSQGTSVESGRVVTSSLGTIAAGATATVTLQVNVDLPLGGTVDNIATATATETETNFTNNTDDETTNVDPQLFSVSGVVYQDLNNNGVQDAGEAPIQGAQIGLFGRDDNGTDVLRVLTTDATGAYLFDGLIQGTYNLFEVQPVIYEDGIETPGTGAGGAATGNDTFFELNLNAANGPNAVGFNFGEGAIDESKRDFLASNQNVIPPEPIDPSATGSLGGRVALDTNNNGVFDSGDVGILGASVTLAGTRTNGQSVVVTARTNPDGTYRFTGVPAGNYNLIEAQPGGFSDGPEEAGSLLAGSILDDVFADIAFPDGANGTGFNFLETPLNAGGAGGGVAPVLAAQAVETDSNPTLSWAPVEGAEKYEVWLTQVTDNAGQVFHDEDVFGTTLTIPTSLALATHRMWVRAIDSQGLKGPWSAPSTFDVSPEAQLLSPTVATVDSSPQFTWTPVSGADTYDLVVQDALGQEIFRATDLTSTSYSSDITLAGGQHTVWVRAKNAEVTGQWADGVNFQISGAPQVIGPASTSILASPMLEWTDTGAAEYRVWVNDITGSSSKLMETTVDGTSFLLTNGLQEGHRYRYWVQGIDGKTNSAWSAPQTFTVATTTTVVAKAASLASNQPTIEWDAFPGATHYDLWISDSDGLFLRDRDVTGTSFTFDSAIHDGDYRVWVKPVGLNASGKWSTASKFSLGGLATPVLNSVAPTTDRTPTITWTQDSAADVTEIWINHDGVTNRIVHETAVSGSSFTPSFNFAPGNYTVWIRSGSLNGLLSAWSRSQKLEVT